MKTKTKITREIANILAQKVYNKIVEINKSTRDQKIKEQLSQLTCDSDFNDVNLYLKNIKICIKKLNKRYKSIKINFSNYRYNELNPEDYINVNYIKTPSFKDISNEILLQSYMSEGFDVDKIVNKMVDLYTKKTK